jgi:hypothetical protein
VLGPGAALSGPLRRGPASSAGVLEQGKGMGWVAREPERSRSRPLAQHAGLWGRRLTNDPGLTSVLHARQERFGDHEHEEERVEPATETIRDQECAGGKS